MIKLCVKHDVFLSKIKDEAIVRIRNNYIFKAKLCMKPFINYTPFLGMVFLLSNFLEYYVFWNEEKAKNMVRQLPYYSYLPFDTNEHYLWGFACNVFFVYFAIILYVSNDVMLISVLFFMSVKLQILQNFLRNLGKYAGNIRQIHGELTEDQAVFVTIRLCIMEHQNIMKLVTEINSNIKFVLLLEFFTNSLQLAANLLTIMDLEIGAIFFFVLLYLVQKVAEIMVLHYAADEIKSQSLNLSTAICDSNYYNYNKKSKDCLRLMLLFGAIQRMIKLCVKDDLFLSKIKDEAIVRIRKKNIFKAKLFMKPFLYYTPFLGMVFILSNFLEYYVFWNEEKATNMVRRLPYYSYLPFDTNEHYLWCLACHFICAYYAIALFISSDILLISFLFFMSVKLQILQNFLRNLSKYAGNIRQIHGELTEGQAVFVAIRLCIIEHQNIMKLVTEVNSNIKFVLFLEFFTNSMQLAANLLAIMDLEIGAIFFFVLLYLFQRVAEIMILHYSADEIKSQSLNLSEAICDSNYYNYNKKSKDCLRLMLLCLNPFKHVSIDCLFPRSPAYITFELVILAATVLTYTQFMQVATCHQSCRHRYGDVPTQSQAALYAPAIPAVSAKLMYPTHCSPLKKLEFCSF
ncbi:unnamed protein product [Brassicogethes aeneus]|uniref:Uncharacterized protein n=1 Tax=Brassicogethes aeneus TaxID=1431903 RepID=A0A9P0FFW0_BRAAE|nr:unnamed protein product [Brassicogethes aeneus]